MAAVERLLANAVHDLASEPYPGTGVDCEQPRLTVAAVARRLGVAPATLRTWDRRYGLGPTGHVSGRHRRYGPDDLVRLDLMRRLTQAGVTSAEAARVARSVRARADVATCPSSGVVGAAQGAASGALDPDPVGPGWLSALDGSAVGPEPGPVDLPAREAAWARAVLTQAAAGGGRVIALPGAPPSVRGLARSAMALDAASVTAALRAAVGTGGVIPTWDTLVRPVLTGIGERWEATGEGVDVEHLVTECVAGVLTTVAHELAAPANSRPVLLACPEGERHALPLTALAAALAERSIGSRMLGAGLPTDAMCAAVCRTGPAVLFLYAHLTRHGNPEQCAAVPRTRPPATVVVGGPGWRADRLPPTAKVVGTLAAAVSLIENCVR